MRTAHTTFRRRMLLLLVGAAAVFALAALALFSHAGSRRSGVAVDPGASPSPGASPRAIAADASGTGGDAMLPTLLRAAAPNLYAQAVAGVVLGMDTRTATADDYRRQLRAEADPNLSESGRADLLATIDARIPADALWDRMRKNEQWSMWAASRTWEPAAWSQVVTGGYAEPGWVMRNVSGTETIHYVDAAGAARTTSREPTLTVVMRCPAPGAGVKQCTLVLISTKPVF